MIELNERKSEREERDRFQMSCGQYVSFLLLFLLLLLLRQVWCFALESVGCGPETIFGAS